MNDDAFKNKTFSVVEYSTEFVPAYLIYISFRINRIFISTFSIQQLYSVEFIAVHQITIIIKNGEWS